MSTISPAPTLTGSPTNSPTTLSTLVTSLSTALEPTSTQSGLPSAVPTNPNSQQRNTSPTQNYLFFIALALGIVFVNLWIILGIRFLYRRRQQQRGLSDPESPNMIPMIARGMVMTGGHPRARQRRKRQKKVVSLAFMDDNFPVTRYADWKNGSYTTEKSVDDKVVEREISEKHMTEKEMEAFSDHDDTANHTTIVMEEDLGRVGFVALSNSADASALSLTETNSRTDRVDPPSDPDTCAICIEQLEDCDEIRVLKCNHVFHISCITPWMTNRNASCPLCKTLYYIPPPPPMPSWLANNGQTPTPSVDIRATGTASTATTLPTSSGSDDSPSLSQAPAQLPLAARATSRLSRFKRVMRLT
ncbi:E3 ubiquitin-protein ligase RNF13 [Yarrowia sp. C11]|nr:E3 ubiquitin-protein ligase RNF13 [Yarrowia sp. C11]KAG5364195.1 E3 ubiquitin-protein ligase RNF13 [Yarrowia sp. E02]